MNSRYDASGPQAEFEPGSGEQVLKNRLGIKSPKAMDDAEARALEKVMVAVVSKFDEKHQFSANDLCGIHKAWLGDIYPWAGEYRTVNVSKDGFLFATVAQIPPLLGKFEKGILAQYTPCNDKDRADVVRALAETHVEFVLIHPYRDGNGRMARILSTLMALQAGLPLLDFTLIAEKKKQAYFTAVQAGLDKNYKPMERLFAEIIGQSLFSS